MEIQADNAADLKNLAQHLLETSAGPDAGAVWAANAVAEGAPGFAECKEAWREAVGRLNQVRNPLRRRFDVPLIFAGAPWLQEVLREDAPDLWSVRTLVARIETPAPAAVLEESRLRFSGDPAMPAARPDPELALDEARKLHARGGSGLGVAQLLERAGDGFASRRKWREAVDAYSGALEELNPPRESDPQAKVRIARVLDSRSQGQDALGEWREARATAEDAVELYRELLKRSGDAFAPGIWGPLEWAETQNNLGKVLLRLGERESGTERLEEAVAAFRKALQEFTRERDPLDWAETQNHLGVALCRLGETESVAERLEEAVAAFRAALTVRGRPRAPLEWAETQNNLANALLRLGERESGTARLEEAAVAYREALREHTRDRVPLDWAMTQNNLGNALANLGRRENGMARLEEATIAFREALKGVYPRGSSAAMGADSK